MLAIGKFNFKMLDTNQRAIYKYKNTNKYKSYVQTIQFIHVKFICKSFESRYSTKSFLNT